SAAAAAASYDSFDDRYLGSKASDPTLDNDGNPLMEGALYWNSTVKKLLAWDNTNSIWKPAGGGPSLGVDSVIRTNARVISENITFPTNTNGMSVGPIEVTTGYTVDVSAANTMWVIV
ncbi:MAG TPA: hypothetical protein V6D20_18790, partial [Candidatus Obscuribacterales bacterium]